MVKRREYEHEGVALGYTNLQDFTSDSGRFYATPTGKKYPSITTILGSLGKKELDQWRAKVGAAEADRVAHHAGTRGSALHSIAERYLDNQVDYFDVNTMPHVKSLFRAVEPILHSSIGKILIQECALYSDRIGAAGRVDLIAEFDGVLSVIDFKTSSRIKTHEQIDNYFIQTAFYAAAFYERTGIAITQSVIIMAVENDCTAKIFIEKPYNWIKRLMQCVKNYKDQQSVIDTIA